MKNKYTKSYIIIACMMALALIMWLAGESKKANKDEFKVALAPAKGFKVLSENPVKVKKGQSASFKISFEEGYFFDENNKELAYSGGEVKINKVLASKTYYLRPGKICNISVEEATNGSVSLLTEGAIATGTKASLSIKPDDHYLVNQIYLNDKAYPAPAGESFEFVVEDDTNIKVEFKGEPVTFMVMSNNLGEVTNAAAKDSYFYGDVVNMSSSHDDQIKFLGWSTGNYISEGGILVTDQASLDYTLVGDTVLYANFEDRSLFYINFDANGGSISTSQDMECSPNTNVNLPVDTGAITRPGYVLTGFNTQADGSGEDHLLGALIKMPRKDITMYASWMKETDPGLIKHSGGSVTGFSGAFDGDTLVIPATIDGTKITSIATSAFANCKSIKTVVLPNGITTVNDKAFAGCEKLEMVYLPETITGLSGSAFAGDNNFTKLRVLASLGKAFDYDYDSSLADKYVRLINAQGKRLILVGGSSLTFGIDSEKLAKEFPDYTVVNFSSSFLYGMLPLLDLVKAQAREGDVIVMAPEFYVTMYANEETTTIANWQYLESNYDMLKDLNIKNTPNILGKYTSYLAKKKSYLPGKLKNSDSVYVRSGMNVYGDLIVPRSNKGTYSPILPTNSIITDTGIKNLNAGFKAISEKGATLLFSYPPVSLGNKTKADIEKSTKAWDETFRSKIDTKYITFISKIADYGMDPKLFYDNAYHLTMDGAALRTDILIKDLKAWGLK